MEFIHYSVMLKECLDGLSVKPDGIYVDGTAGGAGHSAAIAAKLSERGRLVAFDQDPDAVEAARERLSPYPNAQVVQENFRNMAGVLREMGFLPSAG